MKNLPKSINGVPVKTLEEIPEKYAILLGKQSPAGIDVVGIQMTMEKPTKADIEMAVNRFMPVVKGKFVMRIAKKEEVPLIIQGLDLIKLINAPSPSNAVN